MIIVQTPLRVSFLGGGTDYPEHFERHGGAVLGTAVNKYVYITVAPLTRFVPYRLRIAYSKLELKQRVDEVEHPVIRSCLQHVGIDGDIEVNCMSDLPARTGLGSSSSFTVALLHALYAFKNVYVEAERLAREAIHIERVVLGERGGFQDQYWAAVGGTRFVEFQAGPAIRSQLVPLAPDRARALEDSLLMVFTGTTRLATEVLKEQLDRTAENASMLNELRDLTRRGLDALCGPGPLSGLGALLHEGWLLKRRLSSKITTPEIDAAYAAALDAGALGGKLLGAGSGGFLLLYVEPDVRARVRQAVADCPVVPFRFEPGGSRIVFYQQNVTVE